MFELRNLKFLSSDNNKYVFIITELSNYKEFMEFENTFILDGDYNSSVVYKKKLEVHINVDGKIPYEFDTCDSIVYNLSLEFIILENGSLKYVIKQVDIRNTEDIHEDDNLPNSNVFEDIEIYDLYNTEKEILLQKITNVENILQNMRNNMSDEISVKNLIEISDLNKNFNRILRK